MSLIPSPVLDVLPTGFIFGTLYWGIGTIRGTYIDVRLHPCICMHTHTYV